ncbi:LPS export ABC transporter permease LptF [Pseudoroseicyclus tamaricis]|uniref:LPS export ABC transporter permease LptF n=1 Tax=Pseudoroseicyclus tamaricis TaxID=2705421 RepID=A0A6B2JJK5_9RHOB|nr:LPS export ABC transporter permease LptF [Pseudoroseicyclus tamaricis]NDV01623.1 LPS export ABC transporter permease LptF [Pseudoroseicyclus tamaricis]
MGRFDRYLLGHLLTHFGFFALVLVLVYWINRAVTLFDQLIGDGQSIGVFLELTALSLPGLIRITLPIAAFAAAVSVTNRLSGDSELVAAQATGLSPWRLARPVATFGLLVMLIVWTLTHILSPMAQARLGERRAEIAESVAAALLQEGQFVTPTAGVTFYVREITPEGELQDIFLSDDRATSQSITYTATRAYLVRGETGLQLVMIDGMAQTLRKGPGTLGVTAFDDLAYDIGALVGASSQSRPALNTLPTPRLLTADAAFAEETGRSIGALVAEGHDRFAQGILGFVGPLIGFGTLLVGGFSRFGIWRQILAAVGLIILVKVVESAVTGLVRTTPAAWPALYLPGLTGLALAWGTLFLAARPHLFRRRPRAPAGEPA